MSEGERSRKTSIVGVTASGAPTDTPSESLKEPLLDLGGGDSAHMSVNVVDGTLNTDALEDTTAIKIVETEDEHSPSSDVEAKRLLQDSKGAEEVEAAVASCGSSHQGESSAQGEGAAARRTRSRLSQISTRLSFMGHHRPTTCAIDVPNADSPHYSVALAFDNLISSVKTGIEEKKNLPELVVAGSSGSYWVYDANGEKVGIFKPKSEEPYGPANPKWGKWFHRVMCPCCFGRSCLLPNTGYLSEAAAFAMDVLMDLRVVPPTAIVSLAAKTFNYNAIERRLPHLPKKIGSFQVLVQCNGDGKSLATDSLKQPAMASLMSDFQRLVCLDYMTRNTDRGLDNWLTNVSGDKVKVHAIDNGLAFPYKHPDNWRTYPPSWSSHPLGKKPFTADIRKHILTILNSPSWMANAEKRMREIMFMDEIMNESLFQGQMAVIRGQRQNLVECLEKEGTTPEQLFNKHPLYIVRKPTGMVGWKTHLPCFRCC
eukprot:Rhum_TRINITY_DN17188_c0_g1::Rhum_TRINITY_DN17188_c0_g1_i1::g.165456::m.165456/K13711/PI4K2; phosphatidylinositol 4-kinase type 2